jgi:tetratricopeptide (TPR) repeat protein
VAKIYDELKRDSATPAPERRLLLGQIAEFIERHEEALAWYASVPGGPQRAQARLRTATVLHKLERGEEAFSRLRALQADADADDETRRDAYLLEAELHKDDRNLDAELDSYARGLAAYPDDIPLLYSRALMWERRDDIPRAEADLRRILAIDADDVNTLNALGYTLADRTDRYQEALELISRAIAAEPDNAAIIDSYGWVLYRLGRNEEALVELRRAFTKQKDAEIGAHVAEVLWVLGRKDEAMKYFEEARRIDPESRSLQRALEQTGAVLPPLPEAAKP